MKPFFISIIAALALLSGSGITWDKTVHDFGDVSVTDGPLTCTFTVTNNGPEAIAIFEVVSSCGCTDVKWTREPIKPGKTGIVSATYKNEDGPMPFDKTLTVYISGETRPTILRLRGVVHEKKKTLSQLYGEHKLGVLGLKSRSVRTGNLKQGQSVSENITVANLGSKPLQLAFIGQPQELKANVKPNPIPAGETATITFTVTANKEKYGRNIYPIYPVINGKTADEPIEVETWTQENFSNWTEYQRSNAALPYFDNSTFNFGSVEQGAGVEASFSFANRGKSALKIYSADSELPCLTLYEALSNVGPKEKGSIRFWLDTSQLEKGENVIMVTLTTNSPLRPLVNLFVAGEVR